MRCFTTRAHLVFHRWLIALSMVQVHQINLRQFLLLIHLSHLPILILQLRHHLPRPCLLHRRLRALLLILLLELHLPLFELFTFVNFIIQMVFQQMNLVFKCLYPRGEFLMLPPVLFFSFFEFQITPRDFAGQLSKLCWERIYDYFMILILQFQIELFHFFFEHIVLFLLAEDDLSVLLDFLLLQFNLTEQRLKMAGVLQAFAVVLESFDAKFL